MKIYLNTPKIHCIEVDSIDEVVEIVNKLYEEPKIEKCLYQPLVWQPFIPSYTVSNVTSGYCTTHN